MNTKNKFALCAVALLATVFFCSYWSGSKQAIKQPPAETDLFSFVRSMSGTTAPELNVDGDDVLVPDAALRHMFDYYLSAIGETTLDKIRTQINKELDRTLKPASAKSAKELFVRYVAFKTALVDVEKQPQAIGQGLSAIRARMQTSQQLRTHYFSPKEIEGMFGFDDAFNLDAVTRLEINQDKSLSAEEKQAKLAALDAAMPAALREAREAPLKVTNMEASVAKMRASGASDDEIYRVRAKTFSPEAATRLAALDKQIDAWKQRIALYQTERNNILNNATLSDEDRQAALQQWRDNHFSAQEQQRLAAYE
jgi:lipase chaperone LimK